LLWYYRALRSNAIRAVKIITSPMFIVLYFVFTAAFNDVFATLRELLRSYNLRQSVDSLEYYSNRIVIVV